MGLLDAITSQLSNAARWTLESAAGSDVGRTLIFFLVRRFAGLDFDEVGTVLELKLDSKQGLLQATLDLKGEAQPLVIEDLRFKVTEQGGKTILEINSVKTDREWMNTIANLALPQTIELDGTVGRVLGMLK